jgi:hypothetical protein
VVLFNKQRRSSKSHPVGYKLSQARIIPCK